MINAHGMGCFLGADDGPVDVKPAHRVKVDGFLMDRHEVTQEVYEKVIGKSPSRVKNPRNPVEQVTWTAAVKFCNARSALEGLTHCYDPKTWACDFSANGYRLPTEAEWEYACRAGSTSDYYFGSRVEDLRSYAWFEGNSDFKPHAVDQRKPNVWGLYDMAGNVWEWCHDFYGAKYYRTSPADNPHGPPQGEKRVLSLYRAGLALVERHIKVRADANPYDPAYTEYFEKRRCFAGRTYPVGKARAFCAG